MICDQAEEDQSCFTRKQCKTAQCLKWVVKQT